MRAKTADASKKVPKKFTEWRGMGGGLDRKQFCQMACFQTKIPNLGKFWVGLQ
jgi:hypothetical protein